MGTETRRVLDFSQGANTTLGAVTSKPVWRAFDDAIIDHATAQRRLGKVGVYQFPTVATILDFDGVNDTVATVTGGYGSLGPRFSLETLFVVDTINVDRFVLGRAGAAATAVTIKQTTTSTVVAVLTDSAANTATLTWTGIAAGTVCALLIGRNGATVRGVLNGTIQTGTLASATNSMATAAPNIGSDNGASFLDGAVDFLRYFSTYETSQRNGWCRHLHPRAPNVIKDYLITTDANSYVLDRGVYEAHATASGSPATNRAPLCLNPTVVEDMGFQLDSSGARAGFVVVGDRVYPVSLL